MVENPDEAAGYCQLCDRPLPDVLPASGLCRWCEDAYNEAVIDHG